MIEKKEHKAGTRPASMSRYRWYKQELRYNFWKAKRWLKVKGWIPVRPPKKMYCEICGDYIGTLYDYDNVACSGKSASLGMGDYYSRRAHYSGKHGMDDDEARSYSL